MWHTGSPHGRWPRPPVACKLVGERGLLILYLPPEDNFPLAIFSKSFS